jgi:hypothetical protein
MKKDRRQLNVMEGVAAIVASIVFLVLDILLPAREGASPGGKFLVAGFALVLLSWGVRRVKSAKE